jgi:PmbA protein
MTRISKGESLSRQELEDLIVLALDEARSIGADQAEVAASQDIGLSATARLGDVENLEFTNDRGFGITVFKDSCKGSASTSDISPAAIREAVGKAYSFAKFTAQDPHSGLADAELMATDMLDLDLDHPWDINVEQAITLAIECEDAAIAQDKRISNSEGATVGTNRGNRAYGNSHGFIGSDSRTSHSVTCVVLAEEDGAMQRDYHYTSSRVPSQLEEVESVGFNAARKAVARLGARKIKTTNAPVLYVPDLARGFIGHAMSAITGGAQYRRSSFLLDAIGKKIFPDFVQVQERPHIAQGMSSHAFDGEGVATYDRDIIIDGCLDSYILSSYSARRLGLKTTANSGGVQNLLIPGSDTDRDKLIREMGTGLVVEELIGQGVNGVTGDYSRGAAGHWVENGEIQFPVHEVTIAGNLLDLYQRIIAIGNDQDLRSGMRCGSLLIEEMTIAGA